MGAGALAGQKSGKTWIALALGCVTATGVVVYTSVTRDAAGTANRPPAGPAAQAPPPSSSPSPEKQVLTRNGKWRLTWSDEFTGTGAPDRRKWTAVLGGGRNGWSHRALHTYRAGNNRRDGAGRLVITAERLPRSSGVRCWYGPCRYASGRVQTSIHFSQTYGRFMARMKVPVGKGIWPAFWMQRLTEPYGEIDIAEMIGSRPRLVQGYAHGDRRRGGGTLALPRSLDSGFHVYGVDWSPKGIVWWVDGKPYAKLKRYRNWPFDAPFQIILNIQVGGEWPGSPNARTPFPARMTVDWVRVYSRNKAS